MLCTKYNLGDQLKKIEMGGACSMYNRLLVGKPEGRSLEWLLGFQEVKAPGSSRHSAL
jgi:hypothetical protein